MIVTDSQIKAFENFIDTYDSFFISGHKDPDGDSVASCLGVAEILKAKNKSFQLISVGPFRKTEVKKYEKLFSSTLKKKFLTSSKTAFIQVDCSEIERIGNGFCDELKGFPTFIIDHHKTSVLSPEESKNAIIYGDSPAAVFLVQQLYEKIIGKPNKELAQILFFGLCTDTGFFKFLNENSSVVFDAASRLVSCGVNPREIYTKINSGKPFTTRKLLGITLERSVQFYKGKLIVTYETLDDMQEIVKIDCDMPLSYITEDLVDSLEMLSPFGTGNSKPLFALKDVPILRAAAIGKEGQYLRLTVGTETGLAMTAMMFRGVDEFEKSVTDKYGEAAWQGLFSGQSNNVKMTIAYEPSINEFRGERSLQIMIEYAC